jgi:DNA (cytosine-5)-methyltransferase 1
MTAFYSEFDPKAAAWLRELIKQGLIADGIVDERDLWDVSPADLAGFTQIHLCAGIGVWSYALRRAGWPDDRPVWTGSFPCQPFSAAGKGAGFADERHLWPAGQYLIEQCRPRTLFGEQVASKDAEPWLDAVQADLEAMGYAFGACAFPSASIGAPHIRDRTYWVADCELPSEPRQRSVSGPSLRHQDAARSARGSLADGVGRDAGDAGVFQRHAAVAVIGLGDAERLGARRDTGTGAGSQRRDRGRDVGDDSRSSGFIAVGMANSTSNGRREERADAGRFDGGNRPEGFSAGLGAGGSDSGPGPVNGLWGDADWLLCRDGKWRPVEPGTFPLAHGAPARVGRLRGYGNAINAEAAIAWIESYLEAIGERPYAAGGAEEASAVRA